MTQPADIKYVTLTNKGYFEYTNNLLNSIKQNKINIDLSVYTLDTISYDYFSNINVETKLIDSSSYNEEFSEFELQIHLIFIRLFILNSSV